MGGQVISIEANRSAPGYGNRSRKRKGSILESGHNHHLIIRFFCILIALLFLLKLLALPGSPLAFLVAGDVYRACAQDSGRTIHFGETMTGEISVKGERDTYSFQAEAGDTVLVRLNTHWPVGDLQIYAPGGFLLQSVEMRESDFRITIQSTGTYQLSISDGHNFFTGSYSVYLQRTNKPGDATELPYGESVQGSIDESASAGTYTFMGRSGDVILARMSCRWPIGSLWVYGPGGALLKKTDGSPCELFLTLPADGTYTLMAGDDGAFFSGDYSVYLQRTSDPGSVIRLPYGKTISGQITNSVHMDTYVFHAQAGDEVVARMNSTWSGNLRLYSPTGTLMKNVQSAPREFAATLPVEGNYTLLAGSDATFSAGAYSVSLKCTMGSGAGLPEQTTTPTLQPSPALPSSNNMLIMIGVGVAIVIIVAAGGFFIMRRQKMPVPGSPIPDGIIRNADITVASASTTYAPGKEAGRAYPPVPGGRGVDANLSTEPADILCAIISAHGIEVIYNVGKFGGLIKDHYHGRFKRETTLLIKSVEERIPQELLTNGAMYPVIKKKLEKRLVDSGFDSALSTWTVNAWIRALGLDRR